MQSDLLLFNDSRLSALATRGPIQVYVAKYSYNPFEYSPNENPEAELQLNAGDYVLVLGDMDEVRLAGGSHLLCLCLPMAFMSVCRLGFVLYLYLLFGQIT